MASQEYIIDREKEVIEAISSVKHGVAAYVSESIREGTDKCQPENRDCWGTYYVNLNALYREVVRAKNAMAGEFGDRF